MKNTLPLLLLCFFSFTAYTQSARSLNTFGKITFAEKPFTLTGTFKGYNPKADSFKYCNVVYNHLYKSDQQTHTGEIDKNGKFSITFPLNRPQEIMFEFDEQLTVIYAIPGSSLDITLDLPAFKKLNKLDYAEELKLKEPMEFSGQYAQLNKECLLFSPIHNTILHYKEHYPLIDSLDQMAYKKYRMGIMQKLLDSLAAFNIRHNTSSEFRQLQTQHIRYNTAEDLLRYRWMHNMNRKGKVYVALTPGYMSFLDEMPLNNEEAVISQSYSSFLNEYINTFNTIGTVTLEMGPFVQYLKSIGQQFTPQDEDILKNVATGAGDLETRVKRYNVLVNQYQSQVSDFFAVQRFRHLVDTLITSAPAGIGKDIMLSGILSNHLDDNRIPFTPEELNTMTRQVTNPNLRAQIVKENERLTNVLAGNMPSNSHIRSSLQVSEDKFFEELMKPYKGKVVYIDFWAPWCGPCMSEMPSSKQLAQEVKDKNIVFLYIGVSCSKESWQKTIKDKAMEGEHYFANDNEGKLLSNKFRIAGIPHYVLIDKEGKVRDDDAPRPSDKARMLRKFNELLK